MKGGKVVRSYVRVVAEDSPATLVKISSLLCRKGYEVQSLFYGPDPSKGLSVFNIVLRDNGREPVKLIRHINKLVEVVEASTVDPDISVVQ
jgi:acetolactate synthase-1/3 small subunit